MKPALVLLLVSSISLAATIVVPDDYATIQAAIDAARAGDTVVVEPGEYVIEEPLTFRGKALTLWGAEGPEKTTISCRRSRGRSG